MPLSMLSKQVKAIQPDVTSLRTLLDPNAHKALQHVYSNNEVDDLLEITWARYADLAPSVPSQETLGARFMVHLSALTIAMYEVRMQSKKELILPPRGIVEKLRLPYV
ncbi:MAG: hypothetical protein H0U76_04420 [Ktedonobacteraceae bacterium]|nr:hypothetical protein [Ktedonobacteraceae bacterium]